MEIFHGNGTTGYHAAGAPAGGVEDPPWLILRRVGVAAAI